MRFFLMLVQFNIGLSFKGQQRVAGLPKLSLLLRTGLLLRDNYVAKQDYADSNSDNNDCFFILEWWVPWDHGQILFG